jgi:hypothetical protein
MFKDKFLPEIRKPGTMNDKPQFSSTKRPEQKKKVSNSELNILRKRLTGKLRVRNGRQQN